MQCRTCESSMNEPWVVMSHGRAFCSDKCFTGRKGDQMMLYFVNECQRLRLSALEYFELSYMAVFDKPHPNVGLDYGPFLLNGILPVYVETYIKRSQSLEKQS